MKKSSNEFLNLITFICQENNHMNDVDLRLLLQMIDIKYIEDVINSPSKLKKYKEI